MSVDKSELALKALEMRVAALERNLENDIARKLSDLDKRLKKLEAAAKVVNKKIRSYETIQHTNMRLDAPKELLEWKSIQNDVKYKLEAMQKAAREWEIWKKKLSDLPDIK